MGKKFNSIRCEKRVELIPQENPGKGPKRIYIRPAKPEPPRTPIFSFKNPRMIRCKICYRLVNFMDAITIEGGGTQGHKTFEACPSCAE